MKSKVHTQDARHLKSLIKPQSIDVTITSPPYYDMKDYGHIDQIGFGQSYTDYLNDLRSVFKDVFDVTKETGSLWVVIDTFKREGAVVTLPFDFAREIGSIGWKLQDVIIWKKDKTVPWSKKGATRKIFEYVLFFTKGTNFKYYSERVREITDLKDWWIRYPERYSPNGKSLEEIWEFNIPNQGSWGDGYIRHFCPLPEELVKRIITLTTDEKDVVFDPFAGSGTVPAQAAFMRRNFLGFELNSSYVEMFNSYLKEHLQSRLKQYKNAQSTVEQQEFSRLIIDLRILKYARVLAKQLASSDIKVQKIWVESSEMQPNGKFHIASANYIVLTERSTSALAFSEAVSANCQKPPLSKFGITALIKQVTDEQTFRSALPTCILYFYSITNTHKYKYTSEREKDWPNALIISNICCNINSLTS